MASLLTGVAHTDIAGTFADATSTETRLACVPGIPPRRNVHNSALHLSFIERPPAGFIRTLHETYKQLHARIKTTVTHVKLLATQNPAESIQLCKASSSKCMNHIWHFAE